MQSYHFAANMRMRKVKWAVEYLKNSSKRVEDPSSLKSQWKKDYKQLHVEIGCGKGNYSMDMARMYPQDFFVAIEKNESAAGIAAKKFDEAQDLNNLCLIHGDAISIGEWFDKEEIDVIHLNFSDPWPKKRYAKRRLSSSSFLDQYKTILSKDGEIQMKTDNELLFEYSVLEFLSHDFILKDFCVNYRREPHPEDAITEYEEKFIAQNQPIFRCVLKKKEDPDENNS